MTTASVTAYQPSWRLQKLPLPGGGAQLRDADDASLALRTQATEAVVLTSTHDGFTRWHPGDRFHHLFDQRCKQFGRRQAKRHIAVDQGEITYSYADLRGYANRLAHFLRARGLGRGDRVALLLDRSILSHAAVLAASKLDAAYVPLDASFPADRIEFMLADSDVAMVVTLSRFTDRFSASDLAVIALDDCLGAIEQERADSFDTTKADTGVFGADPDPVAYIIYTSGTTGRPKGVPIRHSSIYNFVQIASELYGYTEQDRVYQGMTIAFDFSVEELWVPLVAGATLVPAPADSQMLGADLDEFLVTNRISAMCCVPTLLGTLDPAAAKLRLLLVSGEACPADLVRKWFAPGRRILNAYGPTETTVTATWSVLEPDREVTIGGPLPTYSVLILDPDEPRTLGPGESGEIAIAGIGLTEGYLNRPEQTEKAFIADFVGIPNNASGLIYRTGDLGRINADSQVEFLGRIDTQVKIRGYRIELDEIAAVARELDEVGSAVVAAYEQTVGGDEASSSGVELVAYLTPKTPGAHIDNALVDALLRSRLPAYMVPSYYEQLDALPLLPSTKVDRAALPPPRGSRFVVDGGEHIAPRSETEDRLASLLAKLLDVDRVSVEADFFDDLGANSLTLATYVTAIRKDLGIKRVSMKRLYQNSTVAELAATLEPESGGAETSVTAPAASSQAAVVDMVAPRPKPTVVRRPGVAERHDVAPHVPSTVAYVATGVAQTLIFACTVLIGSIGSVIGYRWIDGAQSIIGVYLRSVVAGSALFFGGAAALIGVKWLAIGRFDARPIRLWSVRYVRFWTAKVAIAANPLNLFVGTPLYNSYLRLLGMAIGHDSVILARPPVCTDLISIGSNTVIRQDCFFPAYTATNGYLYPGYIAIGSGSLVGEGTVLDINSRIGDNAQLGTTSALLEGQIVPTGAVYQGSPAEPSLSNYDRVPPRRVAAGERLRFTISQILGACFFSVPVSFVAAYLIAHTGIAAGGFVDWGGLVGSIVNLAVIAGFVYFGGLLFALMTVTIMPRLLNVAFVPNVAHPLYGFQYKLARGITRFSNNPILNTVFGDSSMIVGFLSIVGYDLSRSTQTGSNFGVDQRHHSPFLCTFNRNTLVSDGLRMMNMEVSATSFEARSITMPPDTYLGNLVHYPAGSKVGANCLIATKAAVPTDGPMRTGVGLLGSPAFEIPRSVARDQAFDYLKQPGVLRDRLRRKLRSNLITMCLYLGRSWMLTMVSIAVGVGAFRLVDPNDTGATLRSAAALTLATVASLISTAVFSILVERVVRGFRPLEPLYCSLYDPRFWNHERFWKLNYNALLRAFDGTPMKLPLLRLQGARIGAKVFDDGSGFTEPTLVEVGDHSTLNFHSVIQCHSLEDGTFKSDRVVVGQSCTIGVGGFVHYGTTLRDGSVLEADSFLMKGTVTEPNTRWQGNPAHDTERDPALAAIQRNVQLIGAIV